MRTWTDSDGRRYPRLTEQDTQVLQRAASLLTDVGLVLRHDSRGEAATGAADAICRLLSAGFDPATDEPEE